MWITTAYLLLHNSYRVGKVRFWVIVSIPLTYFLSQFSGLFPYLHSQLIHIDSLFFSFLFVLLSTYSIPTGGVLFGIAFVLLSRSIRKSNPVKDFLIISAYGVMLLYISNLAIVITSTPFPPFGIVSISFTGLAAFLILTGIYHSALSIAIDLELTKVNYEVIKT